VTEDLISTVVGIVKSRVVEVIKIMYDTPRKKRIGAAPSEASKGARPVKVACNELLREYGSNAGSMIYCLSANGMLRKITRLGIGPPCVYVSVCMLLCVCYCVYCLSMLTSN
jgi:hypothetical protein